MTIRFANYVDLRTITLDEQGRSWITAMRVGKYNHPVHGLIEFTKDRIKRFMDNVKANVRGIDLDIDYDHKMDPTKGREAAGWVKDARISGDLLQLLVEWTPTAMNKIKEGAYRYFSPEFKDKWTDASGQEHLDVLFGGGITNRPFLKDLLPLNLSELTFADEPTREEGMTPEQKALRERLGLPEDATEQQVLEAVSKLQQQPAPGNTNVDKTSTAHGPDQPATAGGPRNDAPNDANNSGEANPFDDTKLSEMLSSNDVNTRMFAEYIKRQRTIDAERDKQLSELLRVNKGNQITIALAEYSQGDSIVAPAVLEEAKKLMEATPPQLHGLITNMLDKVRDGKGTVQLGETPGAASRGGRRVPNEQSAEKIVEERIAKKLSEDKSLDYADASSMVFSEDPGLFDQYQRESYIVSRDAR